AGKYTWGTLPGEAPGTPGGCGFGTAKVKALGAVTFVGTLGDGTAISAGGALEVGGRVVIYIPLSTGGLLSGILNFRDLPFTSDFDGTLDWSRPARLGARRFANGFDTGVSVIGSRARPVESNANLFTGATGVATLEGGNLPDSVATAIRFRPGNRLKLLAPNPL